MDLRQAARRVTPTPMRRAIYRLRRTPDTTRLWLQGHADMRTIGTYAPLLQYDLLTARRRASAALHDDHRAYVHTVSAPEMAGSLETMGLLKVFCDRYQPRSILDLGSGFSTYVFCRYAAEIGGIQIQSIDDSPLWMARTAEYLTERNLPLPSFAGLESLQSLSGQTFDLVFHDLAYPSTRGAWLPQVFRAVTESGVVVFDDLNFGDYRIEVAREAATAGFRLLSLRPLTVDTIGRFAGFAVMPDRVGQS